MSWLALNIDNNRNVRKSRINGYVRDIQSDRWVITGEAIKFDASGRLVDGQNRCQAIVAAGKGAWVLVVRGISEDALVVLDSGSSRNAGDMLVITGLADRADAKDVGAIARLYAAYQAGDVKHAASNLGGSTGITKSELADAVLAIPDIEFAARHARGMYRYLRLPVSALGVAFLEFSKLASTTQPSSSTASETASRTARETPSSPSRGESPTICKPERRAESSPGRRSSTCSVRGTPSERGSSS
ncbi:hypothetical protein CTI14_01400 [Methylobacterium radiotolerans]|nr:hypothetical protein CTI14_01400 [Methylobacterium radiotolerans]